MATAPSTGFVPRSSTGAADYSGTSTPSAAPAAAAAPAGSVILRGANGQPNYSPSGVLTAQIASPSGTSTAPAPAVMTSGAAKDDLTNKQNQVTQLNADTQNHQSIIAGANVPTPDSSKTPAPASGNATSTAPAQGTGSLDDQVNELLSGLNTNEKSIQDAGNTQASGLEKAAATTEKELDDSATTAFAQLDAIRKGAYPLSPSEQGVLNATQAGYQQAILFQQQANSSYTGQMTELMASLGISTSAPTQAISMIHEAISVGSSKIADLNGQMATSLANIEMGFQKQDFDMVQTEWDNTSKYLEDRVTTLTNMQKNIQDATHQQVSDLQAETSMNLDAIVKSATFTQTEKQNAIDNSFKQQQINETQRHNLATEAATGGVLGGNNNLPNVGTTANGSPDPVAQAAFLAQFSPQVASVIKGLANYTINPSSLPTSAKQAMGGLTQAQAIALAAQYNPNYDEKSYTTRAAMQKNITSGQYSKSITAANTLVQHLAELQKISGQLSNSPIPVLNSGFNALAGTVGDPIPNNFNVTRDAVATEAAALYKGTGAPSESEIDAWKKSINANSSPAQIQGAINTISELMAGKLSTLSDNYSSIMGEPGSFQILTDRNAAQLKSLGIDPASVDPTYGNSPTVKLQNFNGASSDNAALLKQINQIAPQATPDEVLQILNSEGYSI